MPYRIAVILAAVGVTMPEVQAQPFYVVIGDSSAFGETNRTKNPSDGDRGYVKPFADYLAGKYGIRPTVANFAINGETSGSFFAGTGRVSSDGQGHNTNCNGLASPYAQYQRLQDSFSVPAVNAEVKAVTVQFGANNLDAVASSPDFLALSAERQQNLVAAALGAFQADYANILGDVRQRFPNADLYTMGYHNPYNGDPSHPFYPLADSAVRALNQVIEGVSSVPQFDAHYVDVYGAINPDESTLTLMSTWQTDPVNYVHLNDDGYAAVSAELIGTAHTAVAVPSVPEPATLALAVVGGLALFARRKWRGVRLATAA